MMGNAASEQRVVGRAEQAGEDARQPAAAHAPARNRAAQGAFFDPTWLVGDTMLDALRDFPPFIRLMENVHHGEDADTRAIRAKFKERLAASQAQGRLLWLTTG